MPRCQSAIRRIALCGIIIIVSSHERKRIPNHSQLDCLLHGLYDLRTKGTSHIRITGSSRLESLTTRLFVKNFRLDYNKENSQPLSRLMYHLGLFSLSREYQNWRVSLQFEKLRFATLLLYHMGVIVQQPTDNSTVCAQLVRANQQRQGDRRDLFTRIP